jgi:hypothetical protein
MYIGKHYRNKADPSAEPFTVLEELGEVLKLSNGATCKITTLTENYVQTDQIDPESFFRNSANVLQSAVNGRPVSTGDGGAGPSQSTSQIMGDAPAAYVPPRVTTPPPPAIGRPVTEQYGPPAEQYYPETQPQQQQPMHYPPPQQQMPQQQLPQHYPQQMPPQQQQPMYYPQQQAYPQNYPQQPQQPSYPQPAAPNPREDASRILRNIKRSNEVTFNFELVVNVPSQDVARMANNMFNDMSYVDFLTEDLLTRISYDKAYLGTRIREQLLSYINGEEKKPEEKKRQRKAAPAPAPEPVKKAARRRTKPAEDGK